MQLILHKFKVQSTLLLAFAFMLITGCNRSEKYHLFEYVESSRSGIDFANTIVENDSVNATECLNCFNGGGVGVGDFNRDGLPDLVFSGSQLSSKLYLNEGDLKFKDISAEANFNMSSWVTGVNIVDVNADGWDDIFLNVGGVNCDNNCPNLLFVNNGTNEQGIPTFTEMAREYRLDDSRYAQQSVFFDFDNDGDLDVYIVHNKNRTNFNRNTPRPKERWPDYLTDYMLRNDSVEGVNHPVFTNVSEELGLNRRGFGLGLGLADFNDDQRIDLYVSNDFITDDFMYLNQAGTDSTSSIFREVSQQYLGHVTTNAMGMDISDINDDGLSDIMVLDMLPREINRHKRVMMEMNYSGYLRLAAIGYTPQYMRNTLQLGNGHLNGQPVRSSEVGMLFGISATDWSWAPLMVDLDNDGDKDIYVSNGYIKDVIDLDYIQFSMPRNVFQPKLNTVEKLQKDLPPIKLANIFFEQTDKEVFDEVSDTWIEDRISLSNGVAYADLDLDGDLDLVVNNINQKAFLLENQSSQKLENHYLRIRLKGQSMNPAAIGAKVTLWSEGRAQFQFQSVIRGYLSSVEAILHFGLTEKRVDSLRVVWPDGKISKLRDLDPDQVIEIEQSTAIESVSSGQSESDSFSTGSRVRTTPFFENQEIIDFTHFQIPLNEYINQPLLVKQYSQKGPFLAAADVNGIPGEEIYIAGDLNTPGKIWAQDDSGKYQPVQILDSINVESGATFFDADNDKDMDLYVASGGNLFDTNSPFYSDRLYRNDGKGNFSRDPSALPELLESTGCIAPLDIDHDGDIDLFLGARIVPGKYPTAPNSHILINENGSFRLEESPAINSLGMVSGALWEDLDGDGWEDLIVVGEFMSIRTFKNLEGQLTEMPVRWVNQEMEEIGTEGWWNSIAAGDFDRDGDTDFILGNLGLNSYLKASNDWPLYVYNDDYNNNGSPDPVLGQYFDDRGEMKILPVHTRDDIEKQFPNSKLLLVTYEQFANMEYQDLLEIQDLEKQTLKVTTFANSYAENLGNGTFKLTPLPRACQVAPINDILVGDYDSDGFMDALLVGNDFSSESNYGRFDAFTGGFLKGGPEGMKWIPSRDSGFYVPGQSNQLTTLKDKNGRNFILASQNNSRLKVFEKTE